MKTTHNYTVGQENNSDGTLIISLYENGKKINMWFQGSNEPAAKFYSTVNSILPMYTKNKMNKLPFGF